MGKEHTYAEMEELTKETGKMEKNLEKEFSNIHTEKFTKETGKMENIKEKEL